MDTNDNVYRLVSAGVLEGSNLTDNDRTLINAIVLSDSDVAVLKRIKADLDLGPLEWSALSIARGINKL